MTHTIERVRIHKTPRPAAPQPPRKSMRPALGWAAIVVGLFTAVTLTLLTIMSDTTPQRIETPAQDSRAGVPMSADAAERLFAGQIAPLPAGVPRSADAAEHWLANRSGVPQGVPGSADGAEHWLGGPAAPLPTGVPRSADGAERWLADNRK